jgi:MOSC domain-containing protein YiiM
VASRHLFDVASSPPHEEGNARPAAIVGPTLKNMNGTVRALLVKSGKGVKSAPRDVVQVTPYGFDGDHHAGAASLEASPYRARAPRRRQILMVSGSVLDQFGLEPGELYENVVVDGLDVMSLREGQQLRLGGAVVIVTIPCEPCMQMDRVRPGLQQALKDLRGMFVKVLEPGTVRIGDPVCEESAVENSHN